VSSPKQSRFSFPRMVIASLAFSFGEAISSLTLWEYKTASLRSQRQQKGEAISLLAIVRLLHLQRQKGLLRSHNFTPFLISHGHKKDFETLVSGEKPTEKLTQEVWVERHPFPTCYRSFTKEGSGKTETAFLDYSFSHFSRTQEGL